MIHIRPQPVRTDGSNAFARVSIEERAPQLIDEARRRNPDYPDAIKDKLKELTSDIRTDALLQPVDQTEPDAALWANRFESHNGETWLDTGWFFAEMLAYRHVSSITRFPETGRDVFAPVKHDELASEALRDLVRHSQEGSEGTEAGLHKHLRLALWGNRIDLSVSASKDQGTAAADHQLLTDHFERSADHILASAPANIHLIADNAGTELAMDLALSDFLLDNGLARQITIHLKPMPVLVSDAIHQDVFSLLDAMAMWSHETGKLGTRLHAQLNNGKLALQSHFFWTTDGGLFELPADLVQQFAYADLLISKGDANYRRVSNDAIWPPGTRLTDALPEFPCPLLLLRTLKSDTLLEVGQTVHDRLDASEPDWKTTGTYGVAQLMAKR